MFVYSGRCMYGKECFGLVGDLTNIPKFFIMLTESVLAQDNDNNVSQYCQISFLEQIFYLFENMQTDSMGMSEIIYFPNLVIEEH